MSKVTVVVQGTQGCRILTNPSVEQYSGVPHLVNPDLTSVRGLPPEQWRIRRGAVVADKSAQLPPVAENGLINLQRRMLMLETTVTQPNRLKAVLIALGGGVLGALIVELAKHL